MPKQGGPYSQASASTLGTLGPSMQIGLISSESISCIPPFNLEINIAAAAEGGGGQQGSHSQAVCQSALTSRSDYRLCVSERAGPSLCRLPFREGTGGQGGAERSLSESAGAPKWDGESRRTRGIVQIMAKERRKGPTLGNWDSHLGLSYEARLREGRSGRSEVQTIGRKLKAACVVVCKRGYKCYKSVRSSCFIFTRSCL